jgi:hypothetical protein
VKARKRKQPKANDEKISLHPLKFEEVVKAMVHTPPPRKVKKK